MITIFNKSFYFLSIPKLHHFDSEINLFVLLFLIWLTRNNKKLFYNYSLHSFHFFNSTEKGIIEDFEERLRRIARLRRDIIVVSPPPTKETTTTTKKTASTFFPPVNLLTIFSPVRACGKYVFLFIKINSCGKSRFQTTCYAERN